MNDWQDRLVDSALQELHGSVPPDLSARVVLALQQGPPGALPTLRPQRRRSPLLWVVLAAAGVLLMATLVGLWLQRPVEWSSIDERTARLELRVFSGVLESVEFGAEGDAAAGTAGAGTAGVGLHVVGLPRVERHTPATSATFRARAGNRLRAEPQCLAQIGPFGVLAAGPGTDLEVRSMEFSWKHGVVAASTLTLAVVAGTATWYTLTRTETARAGEMLRLEADPSGADGAAALAVENERLRQRVQELQHQNEAMQLQASRTSVPVPTPVEPPPSPPELEPAVALANVVAFTDPRFAEVLAAIDWKVVGGVTNEMGPLLAQLVEAMEKTGEVSTELVVKIQELNPKLVAQVPMMLKAGLPGFGPNGSYTHPLVVANTLASTLAAAGQPLNESQLASIGGLVRSFSVESQAVVDAANEFDLEHLLAETEMKDRFFSEVSTLLGPEQYRAMYPPGSGAYDGASLFGTSLITRPYTEGVPASNASDFARFASNKLGEQIGLDEATSAKVRSVIERMASAAPELWQDPANATENGLRMLKSGRTQAALRRQLEAMREIQRTVPLTPEQLKKLRSMRHILVPLPR